MQNIDELVDRIFGNIRTEVFLGKKYYLNPLNIKKKKAEMEALAEEHKAQYPVFEDAFEDESSYLELIEEFNEALSGRVRINAYDIKENLYFVLEFSDKPEDVTDAFFQYASNLNPSRSSSPDRLLVKPDSERRIWLDFHSSDGVYDSGSLYPRTRNFRTHLYVSNISDFISENIKAILESSASSSCGVNSFSYPPYLISFLTGLKHELSMLVNYNFFIFNFQY